MAKAQSKKSKTQKIVISAATAIGFLSAMACFVGGSVYLVDHFGPDVFAYIFFGLISVGIGTTIFISTYEDLD